MGGVSKAAWTGIQQEQEKLEVKGAARMGFHEQIGVYRILTRMRRRQRRQYLRRGKEES